MIEPTRGPGGMNRDQLLRRVDEPWNDFIRSFHGLSSEAIQEPGVVGEWSVKDLLGHIATWEEESLAALTLIMDGKRTSRYARFGGIDAFNDIRWREHRDQPVEDVRRRLLESHAGLISLLKNVSDQFFERETRFRRRLRLDTYGHYPEHTEHVLSWREAKGL